MSKYVNAAKLIAKVKARQSELVEHIKTDTPSERAIDGSKTVELQWVLDIINSLQQEPRFPQYDNIVDKVFGAGNLEGFEYREAEMLVALAKEALLKSLQQEQLEVDLEKEVQRWKNKHGVVGMDDLWLKFARHFYELGLNARKEVTK